MKTVIVPADVSHIDSLVEDMRAQDRAEMEALGYSPREALVESLRDSDPDMQWSARLDGETVAMFGVMRVDDLAGAAWLLTANRITSVKREAWVHSVEMVRRMHSRYPVLFNYVDARNAVSRRWLERLGFSRSDQPVFINGFTFYPYVSLAPCVYQQQR